MSDQPFGDIPLFRELQRLLASSGSGPINLEIASQVAIAVATEGKAETDVTAEQRRALSEAVHSSETLLAGFTRLPLVEPITSQPVTRRTWVNKTLAEWRWLLERLGARFAGELSDQDATDQSAQQMQMVMKQVGPLLMGLQIGTLIGHLAREVVSGYDPSIPREGEAGIVLVVPNIHAFVSDYALDPDATMRWIAVQDTARHIVVQGVAWVPPYRKSLMNELVDAIEIDTSELERKLMELQTQGLEALQEGTGIDGSIPLVPTARHQAALDRVRAFVGLHEGYAARAAKAVGPQLFEDAVKIEEAVARHAAGSTEAKDLLAAVLGFSLDRDLVATGETFCAAVEQLEGLPALNRVWEAPDNLPTYPELKDPFVWIDRVLKQE